MASATFCPATVNGCRQRPQNSIANTLLDGWSDAERGQPVFQPLVNLLPVVEPGNPVKPDRPHIVAEALFLIKDMLDDEPVIAHISRIRICLSGNVCKVARTKQRGRASFLDGRIRRAHRAPTLFQLREW